MTDSGKTCNTYITGIAGCADLAPAPEETAAEILTAEHLMAVDGEEVPELEPVEQAVAAPAAAVTTGQAEEPDLPFDALSMYDMVAKDGAIHTIEKGRLVVNREIVRIRSGRARYLQGEEVPIHMVTLRRPDGTVVDVAIQGRLDDLTAWRAAESSGLIIIGQGAKFREYLHYVVDVERLQVHDASLDVVYFVGTYLDADGHLRASDGVRFAAGAEQCPYHSVKFARSGSKKVFAKLARLRKDGAATALLTYALGALLKPSFGDLCPHLLLIGDKESGKTTLINSVCSRMQLARVSALHHLRTDYRRQKTGANTNLPVCADEIGRLRSIDGLVDHLNVAYNSGMATHGTKGIVHLVSAPHILLGQDCSLRDEAVLSKLLYYHIEADGKNAAALREMEAEAGQFPMGDWMAFVCGWANEHDVQKLLRQKEALLREQVSVPAGAESDRCLLNYATQFVAAEAVRAYGLDADIEPYVIAQCRAHLALLSETGAGVAERFVQDLAVMLASGKVGNAVMDKTAEGVYVHVESCMNVLAARGCRYDITSPIVMTRLLIEKGLARQDRHRFVGSQLRCVFISREQMDMIAK